MAPPIADGGKNPGGGILGVKLGIKDGGSGRVGWWGMFIYNFNFEKCKVKDTIQILNTGAKALSEIIGGGTEKSNGKVPNCKFGAVCGCVYPVAFCPLQHASSSRRMFESANRDRAILKQITCLWLIKHCDNKLKFTSSLDRVRAIAMMHRWWVLRYHLLLKRPRLLHPNNQIHAKVYSI